MRLQRSGRVLMSKIFKMLVAVTATLQMMRVMMAMSWMCYC